MHKSHLRRSCSAHLTSIKLLSCPHSSPPHNLLLHTIFSPKQATSLAHSLLLVSTSPVINVGVALLLRHAISAGEVAGSLMALAGVRGRGGGGGLRRVGVFSISYRVCMPGLEVVLVVLSAAAAAAEALAGANRLPRYTHLLSLTNTLKLPQVVVCWLLVPCLARRSQ